MPIILISYRRADTKEIARRVYDQLAKRYGRGSVYIDIDSIQPSVDYRIHITQALERALVMITVVGHNWVGLRASGDPRIFDADDPVRAEVETAFANRRPVLPLLVDDARMPKKEELPYTLRQFPYLNAFVVRSSEGFVSDIERLSYVIAKLRAQFWALFTATYLVLPILLILFSQYIILFKVDAQPIYLRFAVAVISVLLGIGLCFHVGLRFLAALITSAVVGLVCAGSMVAIVTVLSNSSAPFAIQNFVPSGLREWQEVIEYLLTIVGMTVVTNVAGWLYRDRRTNRLWGGAALRKGKPEP